MPASYEVHSAALFRFDPDTGIYTIITGDVSSEQGSALDTSPTLFETTVTTIDGGSFDNSVFQPTENVGSTGELAGVYQGYIIINGVEYLAITNTAGVNTGYLVSGSTDLTSFPETLDPDDLTPELVVCFTRGVEIETPQGPRLVEDLKIGDLVSTADHGARPILWIGARKLSRKVLDRHPALRPIRIAAGALAENVPAKDLIVSAQHRMVLSSRLVSATFGTDAVLVAAKKLLGMPGVALSDQAEVEYFHILLERHEVIFANGAASETLFAGPMAMKALDPATRAEVLALFPELAVQGYLPQPARQIVERKAARQFVRRYALERQKAVQVVRAG